MKSLLSLTVPPAAAIVILSTLPQTSQAFDCAKAASNAERAICADPRLKAADDAMAAAYARQQRKLNDGELWSLIIAQRKWMQKREENARHPNNPSTAAELLASTTERRRVLAGDPVSGPGTGRPIKSVFIQQYRDTHQYEVNYTLIRFPDRPSPGERLINAETDEISREAPMGREADALDSLYEATATMTPTYASAKFLSVAVETLLFTGNPRYGDWQAYTLNIDLSRGVELKTGDLFADAALVSLKQSCDTQLDAQKKTALADLSDEASAEGTDQTKSDSVPSPSNADNLAEWDRAIVEHLMQLRNWTFWQDKASIAFDNNGTELESAGPFKCELPMKDLRKLLKPGAHLPE